MERPVMKNTSSEGVEITGNVLPEFAEILIPRPWGLLQNCNGNLTTAGKSF